MLQPNIRMKIIFSMLALYILALTGMSGAALAVEKLEIISKKQANYLTPKNTLSSLRSALLLSDLGWADKLLTKESLLEEMELFQQAGIDRKQLIQLEKNIKTVTILEEFEYKDVLIVVIEALSYSGSIKKVPVTLININGLWKITNKYRGDSAVHKYFQYTPAAENNKLGN